MPGGDPQCVVCTHPQVVEIDIQLIAGVATTDIASTYGLYREGPSVHARKHLGLKRPHSGHLCQVCLMPDAREVEREAVANGYKAAAEVACVSASAMRRHMLTHAYDDERASAYASYQLSRLAAAKRQIGGPVNGPNRGEPAPTSPVDNLGVTL